MCTSEKQCYHRFACIKSPSILKVLFSREIVSNQKYCKQPKTALKYKNNNIMIILPFIINVSKFYSLSFVKIHCLKQQF